MRLNTQTYESCTTKIIFLSFFLPIPFFFLSACCILKNNSSAIFPKLTKQFDWQGHRGARGLAPENTVPAF
jgi:glycerophosphoryl diester phosphodiesterase